ncbi:unnamed protein product [Darwinula stevensoni]|uniref:MARVEL domain-containing protein n=1 Tax=Darwinula stevensoni TaxID=69355 RepID=A0A7R9A8K0_9CRUS|nr:unnamed protein product [Darwinula stevensoni]CAG0896532.1 unnamed protein product [Darwinula stevensoni]
MVWVDTFCGCISTRKGSVVIATLSLVVAIPCLIFLSISVHSIAKLGYTYDKVGNAITISALVLIALYVLSSLFLLCAAENNVRGLHLPWLIVHPLATVGLLAFLGYFAYFSFIYPPLAQYNIPIVFAMFIVFWILTYLWVVVVGNYQRLGKTDSEEATRLLVGWDGMAYPQEMSRPMTKAWAGGKVAPGDVDNKISEVVTE